MEEEEADDIFVVEVDEDEEEVADNFLGTEGEITLVVVDEVTTGEVVFVTIVSLIAFPRNVLITEETPFMALLKLSDIRDEVTAATGYDEY